MRRVIRAEGVNIETSLEIGRVAGRDVRDDGAGIAGIEDDGIETAGFGAQVGG